jgi:flagellar biosynthesis component FlhA
MKILNNIYDLLNDIIKDAKSTRERLIWISLGVFIFCVIRGVDVMTLGIVAGWMTSIIAFYFVSKHNEHTNNMKKYEMENTKVIAPSHDPDED